MLVLEHDNRARFALCTAKPKPDPAVRRRDAASRGSPRRRASAGGDKRRGVPKTRRENDPYTDGNTVVGTRTFVLRKGRGLATVFRAGTGAGTGVYRETW